MMSCVASIALHLLDMTCLFGSPRHSVSAVA